MPRAIFGMRARGSLVLAYEMGTGGKAVGAYS